MSGITSAEGEAIRPKVTIPFAKAWPDEPRMAKAVMFVPNSDIRNTNGPSERLARKKSSTSSFPCAWRKAKTPM